MSTKNTSTKKVDPQAELDNIVRYVVRRTTVRLDNLRKEFEEFAIGFGYTAAIRNSGAELVRVEELVKLAEQLIKLFETAKAENLTNIMISVSNLHTEVQTSILRRNPFETSMSNALQQGVWHEQSSAAYKYLNLLQEVIDQLRDLYYTINPN